MMRSKKGFFIDPTIVIVSFLATIAFIALVVVALM